MKIFFLSLLLVSSFSLNLQAHNECRSMFADVPAEPNFISDFLDKFSPATTKSAGDVLLDVFDLISKAPNKSKVKIYTRGLHYDGIGSLLLLTSVRESRKARDLKFEFYIEDSLFKTKIVDLYAESTSNKVKYRNEESNSQTELSGRTYVVIESANETIVYQFDGSLNSLSLKDASGKYPIPVNYEGRNSLRASPFRMVNGVQSVSSKNLDYYSNSYLQENVIAGLNEIGSRYTTLHSSRLDKMSDADIEMISDKSFDLALQLYNHKKKRSPKEPLNSLGILSEALSN